ncbi:MAG: hypothetical protein ABI867_37600 [Kofleriaceae bacterium]
MSEFPIGCTLDAERFTITHHLAGAPERGLYRGRDTTTGAPVLVTLGLPQRDRTAIANQLAFEGIPRIAKLRHVGPLASRGHGDYDGLVEDEPAGVRAVDVLRAPVDRETAAWVVLEVARIAAAANDHGVTLAGLRPELIYLWGTLPQVAGIAPRCEPFLLHAATSSTGGTCFDALYASPEVLARPRDPAPPHADAFSLVAMLGYWLTGDSPFPGEGAMQMLSIATGKRTPWRGTEDDGELVAHGLALDPSERTELPELVGALEMLLDA